MKYKLLALTLALTVVCWAQTGTQTAPFAPEQTSAPDKTKCVCCDKMASAASKDADACCAHHDMKAGDTASCCSGKEAGSCCGKEAKSCARPAKDAAGKSCGDQCGKDKTASCCGDKCMKNGKGCCSTEKKTAKKCCGSEVRS